MWVRSSEGLGRIQVLREKGLDDLRVFDLQDYKSLPVVGGAATKACVELFGGIPHTSERCEEEMLGQVWPSESLPHSDSASASLKVDSITTPRR